MPKAVFRFGNKQAGRRLTGFSPLLVIDFHSCPKPRKGQRPLDFQNRNAIGKIAGSRIKGTDDYYVSGRNAPTFVIVGTLVACYASTVAFLGESGFSYNGYTRCYCCA